MNRLVIHTLAGALLVALTGCNPADTAPKNDSGTPTPAPTPVYSNETYAKALKTASYRLRGLPPPTEHTAAVLDGGQAMYDAYIDEYLDPQQNPRLGDEVRDFYRNMFLMGQTIGGVDYDTPPNLATHILLNDKPVTELLTAEYCADGNYAMVAADDAACSQSAPPGERAGIMSLTEFLRKFGTADTVNMRRVSVVHQLFTCGIYPDPSENPPPIARTNLPESAWPMNDNGTPDDTSDDFPDPGEGLGEDDPAGPYPRLHKKYQSKLPSDAGARCHDCHGQLNARRPVFTYYDPDGVYDPARSIGLNPNEDQNVESPEVNGQQDYCSAITGDTDDDMDMENAYDCQFDNPPATYLGRPIETLKDFGAALVDPALNDRFYACMTTRHYNFVLGKSQGELSMQAAGGFGPPAMAPAALAKYRAVYDTSGWSSRELWRTAFKSTEFLSSQGPALNPEE